MSLIEANSVDKSKLMQDIESLKALGYTSLQLVAQGGIGGTRVQLNALDGNVFEHVFVQGSSGPFGSDLTGLWMDYDTAHGYIIGADWVDIHAALSVRSSMITSSDLSANGLMNVALNRPATQSSVSPWSTSQDPDIDARVANNGDTISAKFFHTAVEDNPWWRVDLQGLYFVDKIVVYNRFEATHRLTMFSIFGSEDGNNWSLMYAKNDHSAVTILIANMSNYNRPVRFVKLMLEGHGCLHLRECQIFGRHASRGE